MKCKVNEIAKPQSTYKSSILLIVRKSGRIEIRMVNLALEINLNVENNLDFNSFTKHFTCSGY